MSTTTFQQRVEPWMLACFGEQIAADTIERNHRFLEESLELVQACGCTQSEAHQLVGYVFGRPVGEIRQETGGVMVTLAALCRAQGISMHEAGETELARIWTKVEAIRAKQAAKPKHSPLPGPAAALAQQAVPDVSHVMALADDYAGAAACAVTATCKKEEDTSAERAALESAIRDLLAAAPAAPAAPQAPAPAHAEPHVWLYDFMDGATTVRNWSTTNKAEAFAPCNFNQRGYVPVGS